MKQRLWWVGVAGLLVLAVAATAKPSETALSQPHSSPDALAHMDQFWQCRLAQHPTAFEPFILEGKRALGADWRKLDGEIVVPWRGTWRTLNAIFYLSSTLHGTAYKAVAVDSLITAWIGRGYARPGWDLSFRDGNPPRHELSVSIDAPTRTMLLSLTNHDAVWSGTVEYRCNGSPYYILHDYDSYQVTPPPTPSPQSSPPRPIP